MLIVVDADSGVPVYRQIVDQIRFQVASGLLRPGAELPSTRTLSQELGVNPMTVSKSYGVLESEGLLTRRPGLPLVVSVRTAAAAEREKAERLRVVLEPAAVAVRQLGMDDDEAVAIFRQSLEALTIMEEQRG
jgi:GntR family transcriptional regulator